MSVDYIVRKGAHLFEFCLLGIAVMHTVFVVGERFGRNVVGYGFFCVLMIAVIDEYIQSFSDRTSSVGDILIDFAGACVGFLFVWGIKTIIRLVGVHCR